MKYMKNIGNEEYRRSHLQNQQRVHQADLHKMRSTPPPPPVSEPKKPFSLGINRWAVVGFLALCALICVLSVGSVITVNTSLKENGEMKERYNDLIQHNELLIKQINHLESPERITAVAREKFGMIVPQSVPKFVNQ
ncbi:MAG: septum formation initiator family protein [Candidatus Kapabacteria bacterium]|nr:septum formation initiator family protein [Candidatus Kapabacteria bacterium]